MAKRIVRYKLEGDGSIPKWISNGGQFKDGHEFIGLTVDDEIYWVPDGLSEINEAALTAKVLKVARKDGGVRLSPKEVAEKVKAWKRQVDIE